MSPPIKSSFLLYNIHPCLQCRPLWLFKYYKWIEGMKASLPLDNGRWNWKEQWDSHFRSPLDGLSLFRLLEPLGVKFLMQIHRNWNSVDILATFPQVRWIVRRRLLFFKRVYLPYWIECKLRPVRTGLVLLGSNIPRPPATIVLNNPSPVSGHSSNFGALIFTF